MDQESNYSVELKVGTALTDENRLLSKQAPDNFSEVPISTLVDYVLQDEFEDKDSELAIGVQRIMAATKWGGFKHNYSIEVNGRPAKPSDKAIDYLDNMADSGKDGVKKIFTIRVSQRDGGGLYQ